MRYPLLLTLLFVFGSHLSVKSQQIPQYTQWFWHQFAINPAHAGIKPCADIKTLYRTQWVGLDGAPNSGFLTFSTPIFTKRKRYLGARQGIGAKFERDQIGPFTANRFNLSYAGHFNFSKDTRLSIGISAGFQQWIFDKTKTTTLVADPLIAQSGSVIAPDASLGFWWNGKNYYMGLVLNQLARSSWGDIGQDSRFKFHTLLNGGFRWQMRDDFTMIPSVLLRLPPKGPVSMDLNLLFDFRNQFGFGLGYRNTDAVMAYFNVRIKEQLTIGYSFDYVLSSIGRNEHFSHEISLGFSTCKSQGTSKTACPLFE